VPSRPRSGSRPSAASRASASSKIFGSTRRHASRVYTSVPARSPRTPAGSGTRGRGKDLQVGDGRRYPRRASPIRVAGGGDTELAVDTAGTCTFNDLTLVNFSTARSGRTTVRLSSAATPACRDAGCRSSVVRRRREPETGDGLGTGRVTTSTWSTTRSALVRSPVRFSGAVNNVLAMYRSADSSRRRRDRWCRVQVLEKVSAPLSCDEGIMGTTRWPRRHDQGWSPAPSSMSYVIHDDATFSRILIGRCFPGPVHQPIRAG